MEAGFKKLDLFGDKEIERDLIKNAILGQMALHNDQDIKEPLIKMLRNIKCRVIQMSHMLESLTKHDSKSASSPGYRKIYVSNSNKNNLNRYRWQEEKASYLLASTASKSSANTKKSWAASRNLSLPWPLNKTKEGAWPSISHRLWLLLPLVRIIKHKIRYIDLHV